MKGRQYKSNEYRYGFNGKENDTDFGNKQVVQDYGFRLYNPSIAKFLSFDPLAASFPWNAPYSFAENDIIRNVDLDGLEKAGTKSQNLNAELDPDNIKYAVKDKIGDWKPTFANPSTLNVKDPVSVAMYREQQKQASHNLKRAITIAEFLSDVGGSMAGWRTAYTAFKTITRSGTKKVIVKKVAQEVIEEVPDIAENWRNIETLVSGVNSQAKGGYNCTSCSFSVLNVLINKAPTSALTDATTHGIPLYSRLFDIGAGNTVEWLKKTYGVRSWSNKIGLDNAIAKIKQAGAGSVGVLDISWKSGGGHVINIVYDGKNVKFIDGQGLMGNSIMNATEWLNKHRDKVREFKKNGQKSTKLAIIKPKIDTSLIHN